MPPPPRLVPVAPTGGDPASIDRSPFWIGSGAGASLRVAVKGIAERHVSITAQGDVYYLSPFPGIAPPRVNGRPVTKPTKLSDGHLIELMPKARWEFVTGAPRISLMSPSSAPARPEGPPRPTPSPPAPALAPVPASASPKPKSRSVKWTLAAVGAVAIVVLSYLGYRAVTPTDPIVRFSEQEGQLYDSLLVESTRSIERGSTLLDLGLKDAALNEFANAITVFETSIIGSSRYVRPTIDGLLSTIQNIYRHAGLAAPGRFAGGSGRSVDLSKSLRVQLSVQQFKAAVSQVRAEFRAQFARDLEVTGADHPEHLSLYGPGGALDIRVLNLSETQISFLIARFTTQGIRVKDFSKDAVLQQQIRAAIAAGLADRAGTGLHLHIDRFRDRHDRWSS